MEESLLDSSVGKKSACNAGDPSSIPGSGRSTGEGIGYPLQYSWASVVAQLVKNPPAVQETWVGKIPWRRQRLPTPVSWPGEFHGLGSPWGHKELDTTEPLSLTSFTSSGKNTRPFRYDLNQIPYDFIVQVTKRFKGLDLVDRVPEELWT